MTKIALIGNPNSGKSTFFNAVTNAKEHVGNWHGVTVDFVEKKFALNGQELVLVDLPGTYSLSPYSAEEEVTRDYLMSQKNGSDYIVIYQMICLKTVNQNGLLARKIGDTLVPFDVDKLTRDLKWFNRDTILVALELFYKYREKS